MRLTLAIVFLLAANGLWFWLMAEMRGNGYPVTYVNFLADLKSMHRLIVDTRAVHHRRRLTFGLIVLYALVAAVFLAVVL